MRTPLKKAQLGAAIKAIGKGFKSVKPAFQELRAAEKAKKLADLQKAKRADSAKKAAATRAANKAKALEEAAAKSKRGRKPKGSTTPPPSTPGTKNLQEVKVTAKKNTGGKKLSAKAQKERYAKLEAADKKLKSNFLKASGVAVGSGIVVGGIGKAVSKPKPQPSSKSTASKPSTSKPVTSNKGTINKATQNLLKNLNR